jgi:hypothetical protein
MLTAVFVITAFAAICSLVADAVALHWHHQDRKRRDADPGA